jgi:methyltransferase (TIGR00027 family)
MRENAPSATAYLIAASIAYSAREPNMAFLTPSHASALSNWVLADSLPQGSLLLWALQQRWFRACVRRLERATLPGIQAHYLVRKRGIEDATRRALEEGVRQVVVLGAGFDSLCWHLHTEYTSCLFFEIDHPRTQQVKRAVLERRVPLRPNLQFLAMDFTLTDIETELRACPRFNAGMPTLFIMEGLLMYLSSEEVSRLFRAIACLGTPQTRALFTFLEPQSDGRVNFPQASRLVTWWLRRRGENFRWGIKREELPGFLAAHGFRIGEVVDDAEFRRRYLNAPFQQNLPLAEGEFLCTALRQE